MKKQIMLLTLFFVCVSIMGSASAVDNSTYGIGANVTQQAMSNTNLALNQSDDNLLITTASSAQLNNQSTESSVQGVVDTTNSLSKGQAITYGSGNLLTINNPNGALWYLFVSKTGNNLMAQKYTVDETGTITSTGVWNIGTNQNSAQLQAAINALGYNLVAIANLWAQGAPADLLAGTYTAGTVNEGTLINYAITRQFQQNYPGATLGTDSWTGTTSNYIFASSGTSGIDTAIYGDYGFSYYYRVLNGGDSSKIGIMQYSTVTKSGLIAVMQLNNLKGIYSNIYGPFVSGTISELLFNNWVYSNYLVSNHVDQLYSVVMLKSVDEAAYNYLWFNTTVGYGHGLDESYISKLPDLRGSFDQSQSVLPVTDIAGMKELGEEAFNQAMTSLGYTSLDAFVSDIKAGKVGVITLPYYYNVMKNGVLTSLAGFIDGVNYMNVFTIDNLLPVSSHIDYGWDTVQALFLHVTHLDLSNAANTVIAASVQTFLNTSPDDSIANWGGVKGMKVAWAQQEPYDYLMTLSRVGCRCSAQDYASALWGMEQYPLGPNEYYQVVSLSGYSQMDSARTTIIGVSPSQGTYLTPGSTNDATAMYILIRWNSVTNTGIAAIINYDSSVQAALMSADGYKNGYNWFLDKVLKNPNHLSAAFGVQREIPLTTSDRTALLSSNDPVSYIENFVPSTPVTPITPSNPGKGSATGNGLATVGGVLNSTYNNAYSALSGLTGTTTTSAATSSSEIAPGLTVSSNTPAAPGAASTNTSTGKSSIPIGVAVGAIILAIAAVLIYLGRNTITATIKGHKSEKLGK